MKDRISVMNIDIPYRLGRGVSRPGPIDGSTHSLSLLEFKAEQKPTREKVSTIVSHFAPLVVSTPLYVYGSGVSLYVRHRGSRTKKIAN